MYEYVKEGKKGERWKQVIYKNNRWKLIKLHCNEYYAFISSARLNNFSCFVKELLYEAIIKSIKSNGGKSFQ